MPLGRLRSGPREQPTPLPAAGSSKLCQLPSSAFPQQWDQAGHEMDADAMDVDAETCQHPAGTSELLSYAQSLTLSHSLASTRQRHLTSILPRIFNHSKVNKIRTRPFAAVEYFPSTSFHAINAEPVKGKGKQKAANQDPAPTTQATLMDGPPAHELSCIGWCGLQVGPVEHDGVSIWLGKFVRDRPGETVNLDAQRRERERQERERKERERQIQVKAAAKRQQANAQSLKPADIPLTLIQKVNQAASQNPWLATLIHKAAKHEASKDELTQLGKVVSTLQAQLAAEPAKAKAGTSTPSSSTSSSTPKPASNAPAVSSSSNPVTVDPAAPPTTAAASPAVGKPTPANGPVPVSVKPPPPQSFAPPFAARQVTATAPHSTQQAQRPVVPHAPQYPPPRPQVQRLPEVPSIPFIVISFRDNPSDKFLLPLGTQSFMSRVPLQSTPATRPIKKEIQTAKSFPTLDPEEQEISAELNHYWEHPPAPGTILISYLAPCAGWKTPDWPAKPRPGAVQVTQSSNGPPSAQPSVANPAVKPAPVAQPDQVSIPTPVASVPPPATQVNGNAPTPAATAPEISLRPGAVPAAATNTPEAAPVSVISPTAKPSDGTVPTLSSAPVVPSEVASPVAPPTNAASQPAPSPESKSSMPVPSPVVSSSDMPALRPPPPVYPPPIRLSTTSLIPDKGAVRPVTIRLTGVTEVTWRAMQDIVKVVEFDEMGDLALEDPPAVPPAAQASPATAVADASALSASEKLTRAAEEERRKEEEKRLAKLKEEYEAKEAARQAKIASRYERKAATFRKLMERVPPRSFLKHRLEQAPPELVEAETDKFGPRLYNIYPRSRFGLPPPAYKSTMDDTAQLELDLEDPSAATAAPNPRKRKSEPAVAFEVPMSFDDIDEAVEQQARKALLKGHAGPKRRRSEVGEDNKRKVGKRSVAGSICEGCGSTKFRVWRKGPGGKATLCKNCGDKFSAGTLGPLVAPGAAKLKTEPIPAESGTATSAQATVTPTPTAKAASSAEGFSQSLSAVQPGATNTVLGMGPPVPVPASPQTSSQPNLASAAPSIARASSAGLATSAATATAESVSPQNAAAATPSVGTSSAVPQASTAPAQQPITLPSPRQSAASVVATEPSETQSAAKLPGMAGRAP